MKATANKAPVEGTSPLTPFVDGAPRDATGSNIDQLRDIIFGGQMRDYEKRFSRMEERLAKEVGDLREEVRQRYATLERFVRDELESLTGQLQSEQQARAGEERRLAQSLADAARAADERVATTTELMTRQHRELRAQLLERTQTLTDEAQRRFAELRSLIDQEASRLGEDKADRSALSTLFLELGLRLRGESVVPGEE